LKNSKGITKKSLPTYIVTIRPALVNINQVNIGSRYIIVIGNIKLNVEVDRKKVMNKTPPRRENSQIGSMEIELRSDL